MRFLLLPALLVLAGCGEPIADAGATKAAPAKKPVLPRAEAAPAGEEWFYNPAGKRDPFGSFLTARVEKGAIDKDLPSIQRWDTDRYSLTGVIWEVDAPRAMLVDPEGFATVVKHGSYVGRNWGKVTSISADGVVVTEEYRMIDGELVVNPVTIKFSGAGVKK